MKRDFPKFLIISAMLTAIAVVLTLVSFPLPMFPPWLKLDFADVPAMIGGLYCVAFFASRAGQPGYARWKAPVFGSLTVFAIILVKNLLNILFKGPTFGGIGELANLIMGLGLSLPIILFYSAKQRAAASTVGAVIGGICATVLAVFTNVYMLIPATGIGMDALSGIMQPLFALFGWPADSSVLWGYGLVAVIPFNLIKMTLQCVIGLVVYHRLEKVLVKSV